MNPPDLFLGGISKIPPVEGTSDDSSSIDTEIFFVETTKEMAQKNIRKMLDSDFDEFVSLIDDGATLQVKFENLTEISSEAAIEALFSLLQTDETLKSIVAVRFVYCDIITCAIRALIAGMNTTPRITTLIFHMCNLSGIAGLQLFNKPLPFRENLQSLSICGQIVDSMFMESLTRFLDGNTALKFLYLTDNRINDFEVQILADALKKNKALEGLFLGNNSITSKGALEIAWMLRTHPALKEMSLKENAIEDAGARAIGQALHDRKEPPMNLGLEGNPITAEGAEYLIQRGDGLSMLGLRNIEKVDSLSVLDAAVRRKGLLALSLVDTGISDKTVKEYTRPGKKARIDPECKLELHTSRTNLSHASIESLKGFFDGTPITVVCDPITSDDESYAGLIRDINTSPKPDQGILNRILAMVRPADRQALFTLFLSMHFRTVQIPRDRNCLFTSIAQGMKESDPFLIQQFIFHYLEKYQKDLAELIKKFQSLTLEHALRQIAVHYIEMHPDDFKPFMFSEDYEDEEEVIDEGVIDIEKRFQEYCKTMKNPKTFGGEFEIQALMGAFREFKMPRALFVFDVSKAPKVVDGEFVMPELLSGTSEENVTKIYLSYLQVDKHYNLLIRKTPEER